MPDRMRIAVFGGVYNNYLALEAALADARSRGVDAVYCLGDLGAFGPHPDRVFPLLHEYGVLCIQGNYDNSIGEGSGRLSVRLYRPARQLFRPYQL